jgi:hypothetical protein
MQNLLLQPRLFVLGFVEMSACYKHIKTHERSQSESENAKAEASTDLQGDGNGISPPTTDSG